ncbi:MAG: DUF4833 domain-containing protein [Saprospiraceae bacterium]|nr:DUF4833 domain-containing protein [Saprospiraceae bacterium]MCB9310687.1 DUF4833 domain-containing protein [Lewinellaceae bacterium]
MNSNHDVLGLEINDYPGMPQGYPIPTGIENLLLFIQRNNTYNSVIFEANLHPDGAIQTSNPMQVYWWDLHHSGVTETHPINAIQQNLAYGYEFEVIHPDLIRFYFKVYPHITFFISKIEGKYKVTTKVEESRMVVTNLYVHTEDLGVFPQVIFVEFYGYNLETNQKLYFKLTFQN